MGQPSTYDEPVTPPAPAPVMPAPTEPAPAVPGEGPPQAIGTGDTTNDTFKVTN